MLSGQAEIIALIIREAEPLCEVSSTTGESKSFNQMHEVVEIVSEGVNTAAELSEMFQLLSPRVSSAASKVSKFLSFVPSLMDVGKKITSQFHKPLDEYLGLPPKLSRIFKEYHQDAYKNTQSNLIEWHKLLSECKPEQHKIMEQLLLGSASANSIRPNGLLGVKHLAEHLKALALPQKKLLVDIFTQACEKYQHRLHRDQPKCSLYLMLALIPLKEQGRMQNFFADHTSKHGITVKMQHLLQDASFPHSLPVSILHDADLMPLCDPLTLRQEAYAATKNILANPTTQGITRTDIVLNGNDTLGYTLAVSRPLDNQLKYKIVEKINVSKVIKTEILELAEFLKATKNPENQLDEFMLIQLKIERIILFLHETDCHDELARILNAMLENMTPDLVIQLNKFYGQTIHPTHNFLSNHISLLYNESSVDEIKVASVEDAPGFKYSIELPVVSATEHSIALINAEAASLFYERHLMSEEKIQYLLSQFKNELSNLDSDAYKPSHCVGIAMIIRLMTVINAEKHPLQAEAYLSVFNLMKNEFINKMKSLESGNLQNAMTLSILIMKNLMETSYYEYLTRLEERNSSLELISSTFRFLSKGADITSLFLPATDVVTVPLSLTCAGAAALIDLTKNASNVVQRGKNMINKLVKELNVKIVNLKKRDAIIRNQAVKNASLITPEQQQSIQAIHRFIQETVQKFEEFSANLQTIQKTFESQMGDDSENPFELLSTLQVQLISLSTDIKEAEQRMSGNIQPNITNLEATLVMNEPAVDSFKSRYFNIGFGSH